MTLGGRGCATVALCAALATPACSSDTPRPVGGDEPGGELVVLAASSLTAAFTELAEHFEAAHPGVDVRVGFGGSSGLAEQIRQGAPADVFAAADEESFELVADRAGDPVVVARNRLAILVEPGNPESLRLARDLARTDLTYAVCDPTVPCGRLAARLLDELRVGTEPVSFEGSVTAVVGKVVLGEVDAGVVFASDVVAAGDAATGVSIPDAQNPTTSYPIAVLDDAPNPVAARAWVSFVTSERARRIFVANGLLAP